MTIGPQLPSLKGELHLRPAPQPRLHDGEVAEEVGQVDHARGGDGDVAGAGVLEQGDGGDDRRPRCRTRSGCEAAGGPCRERRESGEPVVPGHAEAEPDRRRHDAHAAHEDGGRDDEQVDGRPELGEVGVDDLGGPPASADRLAQVGDGHQRPPAGRCRRSRRRRRPRRARPGAPCASGRSSPRRASRPCRSRR